MFVRVVKGSIIDQGIMIMNMYSICWNWFFIVIFSNDFILKIRFCYSNVVMFSVFFQEFSFFFNYCFVCFFFFSLYMFMNFIKCVMKGIVVNLWCLFIKCVF